MPATETEARARRLPPVLVGIGTRMRADKLRGVSDEAMAGGMPVAKLSEDETKALIACLNSLKYFGAREKLPGSAHQK